MARLVDSAIAQLDLMIDDPTVGAIARPDVDDQDFAKEVSGAIEEYVRPALDRLPGRASGRRAAVGP